MARLLGCVAGIFVCFDGMLFILSPRRWGQLWRDVGSFMPAPVDQYLTEVIDLTEKYEREAPGTFRMMWGLEVLAGLVLLRLASRGR